MSNNQSNEKKEWLKRRFEEGLVFYRSEERGKCFIEYIPAENAWVPIVAEGYLYINCLWVSGTMKGHGYSNDLLDACIRDAKEQGRKGLCILSSEKKKNESNIRTQTGHENPWDGILEVGGEILPFGTVDSAVDDYHVE